MKRYQREKYHRCKSEELLLYDFICDMDLEKKYNEYRNEEVEE